MFQPLLREENHRLSPGHRCAKALRPDMSYDEYIRHIYNYAPTKMAFHNFIVVYSAFLNESWMTYCTEYNDILKSRL